MELINLTGNCTLINTSDGCRFRVKAPTSPDSCWCHVVTLRDARLSTWDPCRECKAVDDNQLDALSCTGRVFSGNLTIAKHEIQLLARVIFQTKMIGGGKVFVGRDKSPITNEFGIFITRRKASGAESSKTSQASWKPSVALVVGASSLTANARVTGPSNANVPQLSAQSVLL